MTFGDISVGTVLCVCFGVERSRDGRSGATVVRG